MKKLLIIPALLLSVAFSSCNKESVIKDNKDENIAQSELTAKVAKMFGPCNNWRIEALIQNGTDATSNYGGYTFAYCENNVVNVYNDLFTFGGNWWILLAKGGPGYFELDFKLNDQTGHAAELEGMWVIAGMDEDKITLDSQDGLTRLVFTKISK